MLASSPSSGSLLGTPAASSLLAISTEAYFFSRSSCGFGSIREEPTDGFNDFGIVLRFILGHRLINVHNLHMQDVFNLVYIR